MVCHIFQVVQLYIIIIIINASTMACPVTTVTFFNCCSSALLESDRSILLHANRRMTKYIFHGIFHNSCHFHSLNYLPYPYAKDKSARFSAQLSVVTRFPIFWHLDIARTVFLLMNLSHWLRPQLKGNNMLHYCYYRYLHR